MSSGSCKSEAKTLANFMKTCETLLKKYDGKPNKQKSILRRLDRCKNRLHFLTIEVIHSSAEGINNKLDSLTSKVSDGFADSTNKTEKMAGELLQEIKATHLNGLSKTSDGLPPEIRTKDKLPAHASIEDSGDYKRFVQIVKDSQRIPEESKFGIKCLVFIFELEKLIVFFYNGKAIQVLFRKAPQKFCIFREIARHQREKANKPIPSKTLCNNAWGHNRLSDLYKMICKLNKELDFFPKCIIFNCNDGTGYRLMTSYQNIELYTSLKAFLLSTRVPNS